MIQVTPVILCGGSGTRLWPLSRTGFPKQFLCLTGQDSLFQQTATRLAPGITVSPPLLVTGEDHRFLAAEQLHEAGIALGHVLMEPTGRNTAPALTLAALAAQSTGQDPVLVIAPAVLVADRTRSQDVKHIVNSLSKQGREEHTLHRKVHRPWGW